MSHQKQSHCQAFLCSSCFRLFASCLSCLGGRHRYVSIHRSNPFKAVQDISRHFKSDFGCTEITGVKSGSSFSCSNRSCSCRRRLSEAAFALSVQTLAIYTDHHLSVDNMAKLRDFNLCHYANQIKASQQTPGLRPTHHVCAWV